MTATLSRTTRDTGWLATLQWGDPVDLGEWRVPLGWVLVLLFVGWNGWSLWPFGRKLRAA